MKQITPEQALDAIRPDVDRVIQIIDALLAGGLTVQQAAELRWEIASIQARAILACIASDA